MNVVAAYDQVFNTLKKTALATVVLVKGFANRKAGGMVLIAKGGKLTGAINGGLLEVFPVKHEIYWMRPKLK